MKSTITFELEADPITLSDGSVIIPVIRKRSSREDAVPPAEFEKQHNRYLPDMVWPISGAAFRGLPDEVEKVRQTAEAVIIKRKTEETEAAAAAAAAVEAKRIELEKSTKPENTNVAPNKP